MTSNEGGSLTIKRITQTCATVGLAAALAFGIAGVANAANQDAVENSNELIYYYNSNLAGAWSDFSGNVANLVGYSYIGGGSGASGFGTAVKNNAASIKNTSTYRTVIVYYSNNYGGIANVCVANCQGNLTPDLKNENASHQWS